MNSHKVLLLEPDYILAQNLKASLKRAGYQTDWQVDPQAATYAIDENQPDLIILDITLAGRSGIEFLYEFRSYPEWAKIAVIVYSSISAQDLRQSVSGFEHLNIASFLYKPNTSISLLLEEVARALKLVLV